MTIYFRAITDWPKELRVYGFCQRNYKGRLDGIAKRWWGPITVDRGVGDDASLHLVFRKPGFLGIWGDAFWFWGGFEAYGGQAMLIEWFGD
ncbi:hypothetical protein [Blastococcus deserti]|uniref:Uncharacterized protein n=1 Tax=Blastococcus deserti TaxID=2259033 RepID=A0ABW4XCM4_9ACTN